MSLHLFYFFKCECWNCFTYSTVIHLNSFLYGQEINQSFLGVGQLYFLFTVCEQRDRKRVRFIMWLVSVYHNDNRLDSCVFITPIPHLDLNRELCNYEMAPKLRFATHDSGTRTHTLVLTQTLTVDDTLLHVIGLEESIDWDRLSRTCGSVLLVSNVAILLRKMATSVYKGILLCLTGSFGTHNIVCFTRAE